MEPTPHQGAPGLQVERLTLLRSGRRVLTDVSFDVRPGEVVAIIGPNGSGKTSLLETVVGFLRPAQGRIRHGDGVLTDLADRARVFSFLPDEAEPPMEVRVSTLVEHARRSGRRTKAQAGALAERLGLRSLLTAHAGELSRGEKRRLGLFSALCLNRPVTVLDEPLGAFDPLQLLDVLEVLRGHVRAGSAILLSVHQLSDAEKVADRVLLLHEGRVLAFGTLADLRARAERPGASLEEIFLALLRGTHARP